MQWSQPAFRVSFHKEAEQQSEIAACSGQVPRPSPNAPLDSINSLKRNAGSLAAPRLLLPWPPRCRRRRGRRAPQERCEIGVYLKLLCPVESYKFLPCATTTIPFYSRVLLNATGKSRAQNARASACTIIATPTQSLLRSDLINS